MYCTKCGKEIDDDAVICVHCGKQVEKNVKKQQAPIVDAISDYSSDKKNIGIVSGFFLGILAIVIGLCIYPKGTVARDSFFHGNLIGIVISASIGIGIFIISFIVGLGAGLLYI